MSLTDVRENVILPMNNLINPEKYHTFRTAVPFKSRTFIAKVIVTEIVNDILSIMEIKRSLLCPLGTAK
jgi:hypothetical protein